MWLLLEINDIQAIFIDTNENTFASSFLKRRRKGNAKGAKYHVFL